jgi:hypothetical protein
MTDQMRTAELAGASFRAITGDEGRPTQIEGIAVPYGETIELPDGTTETFERGSFARHLIERGPRTAFLAGHRGPSVAAVDLVETAAGLEYRGDMLDVPEAAGFLARAQAGLIRPSVEFRPYPKGYRSKGRDVSIRSAILGAIAGVVTPAYRGVTFSAREDQMPETTAAAIEDQDEGTEATAAPAAAPTVNVTVNARELATEVATALRSEGVGGRSSDIVALRGAELLYTRDSGHGFLRDVVSASGIGSERDGGAADRLARHRAMLRDVVDSLATVGPSGDRVILWDQVLTRAGDVLTSELGGAIPTDYLPGLLVPRLLKGRPMGGFFQNVGIVDARPRVFPKVTTSTTSTAQSAEGANPAASDFATTAETAQPILRGGSTTPSRQALDSGDPSVEQMIMDDLREAYAQDSETVIATYVAANGNAGGTAIVPATPYAGVVGGIIEYQTDYFMPAERVFLAPALYSTLLQQADSDLRPLVPWGPRVNTMGDQAAGGAGASILGVGVDLSWASAANKAAFVRSTDFVIYESALAEFRVDLDSTLTPANIKLGVWAYLIPADRRGGNVVTAA